MRLPAISELTEEQKDVYLYAPTDRHVLVSGPPGTGKTMIACFRALELKQRYRPVTLGMFNRVLKKFAARGGDDGHDFAPETVTGWFRNWWTASGIPPHASCQTVILNIPFDEKDRAKAVGARWQKTEYRPWSKRGRGVWTLDCEAWRGISEKWPAYHSPPADEANPLLIDWAVVYEHLLDVEDQIPDEALEIGTLLVDEGQDLPPHFYQCLRRISAIAGSRAGQVKNPPRCFILADENQQLTSNNSTLTEIAEALKIQVGDRYQLLDNFRNTLPIARLSVQFYADVVTGLPRLPDRDGEMPEYVTADKEEVTLEYIARWVRNNPGKETGVFTFLDKRRKMVYESLLNRLANLESRGLVVQTYGSGDPENSNSQKLEFDRPDTVTVLNVHSCKGLEFDSVFIINMEEGVKNAQAEDRFMMQMFVATSRARERVSLVDLQRPDSSAKHLRLLPGTDVLVRREATVVEAARASKSVPAKPVKAARAWESILEECKQLGRAPENLVEQYPEGLKSYSDDGKQVALWNGQEWEWFRLKAVPPAPPTPKAATPSARPQANAAPPSSKSPDKNVQPMVPAGQGDAQAFEIASQRGKTVQDKRDKGGCLWILGGAELKKDLGPLGFVYKEGKGWWRK